MLFIVFSVLFLNFRQLALSFVSPLDVRKRPGGSSLVFKTVQYNLYWTAFPKLSNIAFREGNIDYIVRSRDANPALWLADCYIVDNIYIYMYIYNVCVDILASPLQWQSCCRGVGWWSFILIWISNYIHYEMCDEITYPFPSFNDATVEFGEWINNFIAHFIGHVISYPCWD